MVNLARLPYPNVHEFPAAGQSRVTLQEHHEIATERARISLMIQFQDGHVTFTTLVVFSDAGMLRCCGPVGQEKWLVPGYGYSKENWREEDARACAACALPVLAEVYCNLPKQYMVVKEPSRLSADDLRLLRVELPAALDLDISADARFAGGLLALAREIVMARENDTRKREEAIWHKRLKKQFDTLPEGTILAHRDSADHVVFVSNLHGQRTRRSLTQRYPKCSIQIDLRKAERTAYRLMTPELARRLPRGLLSGHEALAALQQAEKLVPIFPDLV